MFFFFENCPKGHGLEKGTVKAEGFECDLCENSIGKGKSIYSCDDCKYDLCGSCAKNEEQNRKKVNYFWMNENVSCTILPVVWLSKKNLPIEFHKSC